MKYILKRNEPKGRYIDPGFAPDIGRQIFSLLYGENVILIKISDPRHVASLIGTSEIGSAINEYYRQLCFYSY